MYYLPPEQLRAAREADARSDQYALGTILYECVTGQRAFEEDSFYLLLKNIAEGEFERPSLRRPGLPERLEAIVLRAMSLDPLGRFDSVKQLGAALLEFSSEGTRMLLGAILRRGAGHRHAHERVAAVERADAERGRAVERVARVAPAVRTAARGHAGGAVDGTVGRHHGAAAADTQSQGVQHHAAKRDRRARDAHAAGDALRAGARRRSSGGVALVAAISVLLILRGTGGGERHEDAESTSAGDVVLDGVASGDRRARRAEGRAADRAPARSEGTIDGAGNRADAGAKSSCGREDGQRNRGRRRRASR